MREVRLILAAVSLLAGALTVSADISPPRCRHPDALLPQAPAADSSRPATPAFPLDLHWPAVDQPRPLATEPLRSDRPRRPDQVQLPPAPDSAALCLWALSGLGIWQLGRSARKFHLLGVVPEWYHTGGPLQVGHATPLDLEFSRSALPLCRFETPAAVGGVSARPAWQRWCEPTDRPHPHYCPLSECPRGPPTLS